MPDYKKLGLKVGLEIHRQIDTNKLFCNCPSLLREDEPDVRIKRGLRAVMSEVGEKDIVAEFEMAKGKYAVYEAYSDTNCLVELDDEPIHTINKEAFEVALQVCLLLNCKIVDEMQIMRKQVLDFSNTSGFQRTCLIGYDGRVETRFGRVKINTVTLEEDAGRKIKETDKYVVYRLDRLGIPLLEISTGSEIDNPEQAKEVASYVGMILKSTGKVKGGIGTVRQDLNCSINGHERVEIKGVQELWLIPKVIEKEVERQIENVKNKKVRGEVRRANEDGSTSFLRPMPGAARLYVETDHFPIRVTKEDLKKIRLPELISEKVVELEKEYNLSSELAREIIDSKLFFDLVTKYKNIEPSFIARSLVEIPKEIFSRYNLDILRIKDGHFFEIFDHLSKGKINKDAVFEILVEIAKGNEIDFSKYSAISESDLENEIINIIKDNRGLSFNAVIGKVMEKYRGKVEGKKVAEIIKKYL